MSGNEITNIFKSYKYIKAEFSALEERRKEIQRENTRNNTTASKIMQEYEQKQAELYHLEEFIYSCIKTIQSGKLRALLFERYINCKTWEEVSEAIGNRSEYWVRHTLHAEAISAALAADIPPT